jgi:DNA-3-methyladenine glycosylase II
MSVPKFDAVLDKIVQQIPKPEIISTKDVFHDLMSCVLEQQIHYRSTKKIFQKMLNTAGIERLSPSNFPILEEKALKADAKLSMGKYETLLGILDFWERHQMDWFAMHDNEVRSQLAQIKGIGKWTVDMILLYTLQRPDVFPYDDFHLKQIMTTLYGLDPKVKLKAMMIEISENWGDQKSLAVLYLLDWKKYQKRA